MIDRAASGGQSVPVRQAIDAERLVNWTYAAQKAHLADDGVAGYGSDISRLMGGACATARCAWIANLGCMPDQSHNGGFSVNVDAEAVHLEVRHLGEVGVALFMHGRAGTRPDPGLGDRWQFHFEPIWWRGPLYDDAGRPRKRSYQIDRVGGAACGNYVPLRGVNLPAGIERARRLYGDWHQGLVWLVNHFTEFPLRVFDVIGPLAPAEPWLEGGDGAAVHEPD